MDWVMMSGDGAWDSVLLISTQDDLHIQPCLRVLGGLVRDSPLPLPQGPKAADAPVCYMKWCHFAYNPYLHTGDRRVCRHIASFSILCIQHSARCVANSSVALWNSLEFFFNIFGLWLNLQIRNPQMWRADCTWEFENHHYPTCSGSYWHKADQLNLTYIRKIAWITCASKSESTFITFCICISTYLFMWFSPKSRENDLKSAMELSNNKYYPVIL